MNINHVVIAGRLGKDPELKALPTGTKVANFSIATNRTWKDKSGAKQESTEWVNCVAWGRTAEVIAQYFTKGKEIYIEGRLQTRSWDGKDGKKNYRTEIVVNSFQFVGYGKDSTAGVPNSVPPSTTAAPVEKIETIEYPTEDISPNDIPF